MTCTTRRSEPELPMGHETGDYRASRHTSHVGLVPFGGVGWGNHSDVPSLSL
jgi:hypothetical protein